MLLHHVIQNRVLPLSLLWRASNNNNSQQKAMPAQINSHEISMLREGGKKKRERERGKKKKKGGPLYPYCTSTLAGNNSRLTSTTSNTRDTQSTRPIKIRTRRANLEGKRKIKRKKTKI